MLGIRRGNAFRHVSPASCPPPAGGWADRRIEARPPSRRSACWEPPVLLTVAARGEGIVPLVEALDRHRAYLESSGMLQPATAGAARRTDAGGREPRVAAVGLGRDRPRRRCSWRRWTTCRRESGTPTRWPRRSWNTRELEPRDEHRAEAGVYAAGSGRVEPGGATGDTRRVSVHARHPSHDVPGPALDDAAVRRVRHGRGHEPALQVPARARADGAVGRVRLPHADGLRLRSPTLGGRGREVRGRDLEPGRHGDAVRRHSARPGLHVDDDQRPGGDPVLLLRRRGREAGRADREAARHGAERHPQGVHGAARLGVSRRAGAEDHRRHVRVVRRARAAVEHDLDLRLPHPRGRSDGRAGAGVHAGQRLHLRRARHRARARRGRRSRRACRSSGTSTTTSSRRSRSCAPRAASGRATCGSATAPRTRGRGCCGSTRRPPA